MRVTVTEVVLVLNINKSSVTERNDAWHSRPWRYSTTRSGANKDVGISTRNTSPVL